MRATRESRKVSNIKRVEWREQPISQMGVEIEAREDLVTWSFRRAAQNGVLQVNHSQLKVPRQASLQEVTTHRGMREQESGK